MSHIEIKDEGCAFSIEETSFYKGYLENNLTTDSSGAYLLLAYNTLPVSYNDRLSKLPNHNEVILLPIDLDDLSYTNLKRTLTSKLFQPSSRLSSFHVDGAYVLQVFKDDNGLKVEVVNHCYPRVELDPNRKSNVLVVKEVIEKVVDVVRDTPLTTTANKDTQSLLPYGFGDYVVEVELKGEVISATKTFKTGNLLDPVFIREVMKYIDNQYPHNGTIQITDKSSSVERKSSARLSKRNHKVIARLALALAINQIIGSPFDYVRTVTNIDDIVK